MSNRLLLSAALAAAALVGLAPTASAVDLNTKAGYRVLGGRIAIDVEHMMPDDRNVDSTTGTTIEISPEFGYFFADGLELVTNFNLVVGFGDLHENDSTTVGFDVGLKYFIFINAPIRPYLGALIGMGFEITADTKTATNTTVRGETFKDFRLTIPVGLLIPLMNDFLALDVGVQFKYIASLDDRNSYIRVPIGYLGVVGFW